MTFIDTHCHLDFPEFDIDRDRLIDSSWAQGLEYIINVGSSLKASQASVALAQKHQRIYAAVGIHPHDADKARGAGVQEIKALACESKVVAIGETGLDYYRNYSLRENQLPLFSSLIGLAKEAGLPLVIHSRQAEDETLSVLKEHMPVRAVIHCFSGDEDFLGRCLGMGFYVSFTCNITYKKAEKLRQAVKAAPIERVFLETDAPYLPAEANRGRRNEPLSVRYVAEEISRIKGMSVEEVSAITSANAKSFFGIPR